MIQAAGTFPQLAAAMARSGTLQALMEQAQKLEDSGNEQAVRAASLLKL